MRSTLLALLIIIGADICAQDPFYSNYNFGYSMLNPALTGSTGMSRAESGYRGFTRGNRTWFITPTSTITTADIKRPVIAGEFWPL